MKIAFIVLLSSLVTAFAHGHSLSVCRTLLPEKKDIAQQAEVRVGRGEASRWEIARCKLEYLLAAFDCRAVLAEEFCSTAPSVAKAYADGLKSAAAVGQIEQEEFDRASQKLYDVQDFCR